MLVWLFHVDMGGSKLSSSRFYGKHCTHWAWPWNNKREDFAVHMRELRTVCVFSWKHGSCTSQNSPGKRILPPYSLSHAYWMDSMRLCIRMYVLAEARWERAVGYSALSLQILSLIEPSASKPQQSFLSRLPSTLELQAFVSIPNFLHNGCGFKAWSSCLQSWALLPAEPSSGAKPGFLTDSWDHAAFFYLSITV